MINHLQIYLLNIFKLKKEKAKLSIHELQKKKESAISRGITPSTFQQIGNMESDIK